MVVGTEKAWPLAARRYNYWKEVELRENPTVPIPVGNQTTARSEFWNVVDMLEEKE